MSLEDRLGGAWTLVGCWLGPHSQAPIHWPFARGGVGQWGPWEKASWASWVPGGCGVLTELS